MLISKRKVATAGEWLRELRENENLSLKTVAVKLGIDSSLLARFERGERQPTKTQIERIALYYGIDVVALNNDLLSDHLAFKILKEGADIDILSLTEDKIRYLKQIKVL